ncbi:bifunctional DNA-binding transcriptional regulator/O6-methylguanine-DNA methyltransferase Ada [Pseudomonas sp. NA-150]|uniref:bifunctional DNA-binding transcriptional regulator/O6-methylguanine-DNA methyltransferase Ada n=1 Tax=Pseudomonas sp. NA-150 TaxID=3367525 RepID=UPI0037CC2F8E
MNLAHNPQNSHVTTTTENDPRWARIVARDPESDGQFWYSVSTTGIYCRPSCPSRAAHPHNVRLHDSLEQAQATGFRACKRCNPDGISPGTANSILVAKACRLIEQQDALPSLSNLAQAVGLSASHFHRLFKRETGLTPKGYAAAHQAGRVREELLSSQSITEAMYDAGFNSSGRFYEKSTGMLGMTPSQYRDGGADEVIRFAIGQSSLGAILVASSAKGVVSILLGDDPAELLCSLQDRFSKARLMGGDAEYESLVAQVVGCVEAPTQGLDLPLDVRGTAFQQRVWQALRDIPAGTTVTYSDIARAIGAPTSMRAVAGACAANNIAVAIPCHRVVRHDGSLSGYRWGVERKRALIEREAVVS